MKMAATIVLSSHPPLGEGQTAASGLGRGNHTHRNTKMPDLAIRAFYLG